MKSKRTFTLLIGMALFFWTVFSGCDSGIEKPPVTEESPVIEEPDIPVIEGKVLILQAYGTGTKTDGAVSHSFVELYNSNSAPVSLDGYSLQYSGGGTEWKMLDLSGKIIPAKSSFLILGTETNTAPRLNLADKADIDWDIVFDNKKFKIALVQTADTIVVANPFDTDGEGTKLAGYVDMLGSVDNDSAGKEPEKAETIDGYEMAYPCLLSKQKSVRRTTLTDTDNNQEDFEGIDYRADKGITDEELEFYRPKNTAYGTWDPTKTSGNTPQETNKSPDLTSELPVLSITITSTEIKDTETWIPGITYTLWDKDGNELATGTTDIKGRGNSTWTAPSEGSSGGWGWIWLPASNNKNGYSLKLSSKTSIAGMPKHKRWALLANHFDKTLLRNEVAFKMGCIFDNLKWTPRSEEVSLFMNGEYRGVYQLTEAIKLDEQRVSISSEISAENPNGGYILEIDQRKGEKYNFTTTKGIIFCCSDPDDGLDRVFSKIKTDVQNAENSFYAANWTSADGYRKYFDIPSLIDWYLVNEITKNHDARFYSSVYLYYDPDAGKYFFGPIWDFDISLGNVNSIFAPCDSATDFWIKKPNTPTTPSWGMGGSSSPFDAPWINRLFEDPAFVAEVKARWNEKKADITALSSFIDERALYLAAAQTKNFKKWDIKEYTAVSKNPMPGTYQGEVNALKTWLSQRITWLNTAL
jgi:hypothetical protein